MIFASYFLRITYEDEQFSVHLIPICISQYMSDLFAPCTPSGPRVLDGVPWGGVEQGLGDGGLLKGGLVGNEKCLPCSWASEGLEPISSTRQQAADVRALNGAVREEVVTKNYLAHSRL